MYVDGTQVGEAQASSPVSTPQILRMCQVEGQQLLGAGFAVQLPPLPLGKHEVGGWWRSIATALLVGRAGGLPCHGTLQPAGRLRAYRSG